MSYKKTLLSITLGTCLVSSAVAEISGNIGVTSNYLWRGITQTADGPAVSGGIDYTNKSGFYAGAWVSNVDFGEEVTTTSGSIEFVDFSGNELDVYFGYGAESNGIGYTVGLIHYHYSQFDDSNFTELHIDIESGVFSAGLYYVVDADFDGGEDNLYGYFGLSFDLEQDWNLAFTFGHNEPDKGDDYQHLLVELTKSVSQLGDFTLALSKAEVDDNDYDDVTPVISWTKSF